jgi:hypothetical protein
MNGTDDDRLDPAEWEAARELVERAFASSLHCSVASVNPDGTPHVTPIASVLLGHAVGHGYYLDLLNARLARNLSANPAVCILAVDSSPETWMVGLSAGRFDTTPGIQLLGTAGARRDATETEIARFRALVGPAYDTPGGQALWNREPVHARDLHIHTIRGLKLGRMTSGELI